MRLFSDFQFAHFFNSICKHNILKYKHLTEPVLCTMSVSNNFDFHQGLWQMAHQLLSPVRTAPFSTRKQRRSSSTLTRFTLSRLRMKSCPFRTLQTKRVVLDVQTVRRASGSNPYSKLTSASTLASSPSCVLSADGGSPSNSRWRGTSTRTNPGASTSV